MKVMQQGGAGVEVGASGCCMGGVNFTARSPWPQHWWQLRFPVTVALMSMRSDSYSSGFTHQYAYLFPPMLMRLICYKV